MNKKILFLLASLLTPGLLLFVFTSCNITNPTDGLAVIVSTIERQTLVGVNISDPDGVNIKSSLNIKFTGQDSSKVIDEVNNKLTSISTSDGNLVFAIKDGTVISESAPVKLVLQIRSASKEYMDIDYPVTLTHSGNQTFYIKMIKMNALSASGIEQVKNSPTAGTADASGKVTTPVTVTTASGTSLTVPQGNILKDNNGNPLSGKISVSLTTYSPQAASILPAGKLTMNNKTYTSVSGFSLQLSDQNGKLAASTGSTTSNLSIPFNNLMNPSTNQPFKAGDKLEVIYLDKNGNPQIAGQVTVQSRSTFALSKTATDDWVTFIINFLNLTPEQVCWIIAECPRRTVSFDFGNNWNLNGIPLVLEISNFISYVPKESFSLTGRNMSVGVRFLDQQAVVKIAGSNIEVSNKLTNISDNNSLPVSFSGMTYYDIFVQGKCPSETPTNPKRINPNIYISVTRNDGVSFGWIQLKDGRGGAYLPDGTYTVSATYKGKSYNTTVTVNRNSVNVASNENVQARTDAPAAPSGTLRLWYYIITPEACN